jgi:hypothetical protein
MDRKNLLTSWAHYLANAARDGALTGRACPISRVETISGPRAGVLEIFAGLESGRLLRALSKVDCATLRQFIPWRFTGEPQAYMSGRYVRCEAGWPDGLAEQMIRLGDLCEKPEGGGRWVAGKSETGATVVPGLNDRTPHFLFSGATGSGKSVALKSAILQLSADPTNVIVLVDGKMGESLKAVERLPNIVGPCAVDGPQIRNTLAWVAGQMRQRYEAGYHDGRIIVVFDEFQEMAGDVVISDLLRKLAAQGRAAAVHLLAATQHPTVDAFGDASTRRNLTGKVALRVGDADASRVAVGGATPRADHLLGAGDSYTVAPGNCHRVQLAYVDEREITAGENGGPSWRFSRWPEYEPDNIGQELPEVGWSYTGDELGVSLVSAARGEGRPSLVGRLQEAELGRPGSERAARLLQLGRDTHDWLQRNGYVLTACLPANALSGSEVVPVLPDIW